MNVNLICCYGNKNVDMAVYSAINSKDCQIGSLEMYIFY